jgi:hypothetical protein
MVDRLNGWLSLQSVELRLSMEEIFEKHAVSLVRERHIARALRLKVEALAESDSEYAALLEKIYGGKRSEKSRNDISGVEEELRTRLLKSGGPAFVPEDEKAFLPLVNIIEIIRKSGGIPTYPLLLDGTGGAVTAFESDKDQLLGHLEELGISALEFIPSRNSFGKLKEYSEWFYEKGFTVTFGTEHNTSAMSPLTVSCKGGVPLDESLMNISYKGAACVAAHQYLVAKEGLDHNRFGRREMEELGTAVMNHYYNKSIF